MYRILSGSQEIFNGASIGELPVISARMSEQLNESGNLQFVLAQGHPLYGLLEPMASYIMAYEDDEVIFEGRVLEAGQPSFSGQIPYECEGALSYLMDSEVTPSKNPITKTVQEFFSWCIAQHNADIENDPRRTFTVGNVTVPDRAKSENFQVTSYTQTKTVIENNLINVYGGYLKIRHENGVRYIDWLEHYSDQVDPQPIVIGQNVIEKSFNVNGDNMFTVIRPVGKNGLLLDTPTINVFTSAEINNKYGRIIRSVSFSDADTKAKLQTKANEYIARLKATLLCSGSIQLVDMHYLDGTYPKIKMGARFTNIEGLEGITMTVSGMERDFMEPHIGDFSFGNDKSLSDGTPKGGGSISRATSRAGSSAGMNYKHIIELGDMVTINAETLNLQGETLNEHYEQITTTANQIITMSNDIDDMDSRLQTVEGTGVIQNDELLAQFAGTMRLIRNSQGIVTGIEFVDGTMVMDTDEEGHMVTVGAAIAANKGAVQTIQGSGLWTQRDNITGVCGEFDIVEDPVTHVKTIVIKSGGGMKIRENNVEYGIYHEGNLTGGMVVDKLNDGTVVTKIRGDVIDLTTNDEYASILVTSSLIRSEIHSAKSDLYSTINQTSTNIYTEVGNVQSQMRSFIEQTPDMIHAEVGSAVSGFAQSVIEQTSSYIRMEVSNAASAISHTVIEQTTDYVRTEVSSVASGIAWSVVTQTMTNIQQQIAQKSKVYVQLTNPNDGVNELHDGDIWIKAQPLKTWGDHANSTWNSQNAAEWRSKYGDKHYVWRNGVWVATLDTSTAVENEVELEQTKDSLAIVGRSVDIAGERYNSKLEVTSKAIRSEVSTAKSQLYSVIEQTATHIRAQVADEVNGLQASIAITSTSISTSVSAAKSALYSSIMQTATSISLSVNSAKSALSSRIDVQADKISLVVEDTASGSKIKAAKIVEEINNGASSIIISANHINLSGYVKASQLDTAWLKGQIAQIDSVNGNTLSFSNVYGGTFKFRNSAGAGYTYSDFKSVFLTGITLTRSGNTYTLQSHTYDQTVVDTLTFSRATSLGGAWSGSQLTVSASPQGNQFTIGFADGHSAHAAYDVALELATNGPVTKDSVVANTIDVPIKVSNLNPGSTAPTSRYTKSMAVSVASLLQSKTESPAAATKGWNGRIFTVSVPAKTVSPDSTKIGLSSATVSGTIVQGEVYDALVLKSGTSPIYSTASGHRYVEQTVQAYSADINSSGVPVMGSVILEKNVKLNVDGLLQAKTVNPGTVTKSYSGRVFSATVPATTVTPDSSKLGLTSAKVNSAIAQARVYDGYALLSNAPEYRTSGGHHYIKQYFRAYWEDENGDAGNTIMDKALEFNADLAYQAGVDSVNVPSVSDISIGQGSATRYTSAPSGTSLGTLAQILVQAYLNQDGKGRYVRFPVTINGVSGTKYYYIYM